MTRILAALAIPALVVSAVIFAAGVVHADTGAMSVGNSVIQEQVTHNSDGSVSLTMNRNPESHVFKPSVKAKFFGKS